MSFRSLVVSLASLALAFALSCGGGGSRTARQISEAEVGAEGAKLLGPDGAEVMTR